MRVEFSEVQHSTFLTAVFIVTDIMFGGQEKHRFQNHVAAETTKIVHSSR